MSALQNSGTVPDVFDAIDFEQKLEMAVKYPSGYDVAAGNDIPKDKAQDQPSIDIAGAKGLYTLVVSDPDAPSPDDPKFREFLHWLIINIPYGDISKGKELVEYMGPAPPKGKHRYIFMLWRQTPPGMMAEIAKEDVDHTIEASAPSDRKCFNTRKFAQEHQLRGPMASHFFYSEP